MDQPSFRRGDPFLDAVLVFVEPVFALLGAQDAEAIKALSIAYPEFRGAHAAGEVGHHFMVARSDALPKSDAFELVAATAARYQALGYRFMLIEATNQWTGAACEALGAIRVHYAPFRPHRTVRRSRVPLRQGQRQHALRDPPRLVVGPRNYRKRGARGRNSR